MAEPKTYYLISWVEYKYLRGRLNKFDLRNDITTQHPIEFLIEARQAAEYGTQVQLINWDRLEVSGHQVAAWRRKLENVS